jgi:ubiquitin-associated SH3 domain-containing protein
LIVGVGVRAATPSRIDGSAAGPSREIAALVKLIVYACPMGDLGEQVERFFEESRRRFGANEAHAYMPHCSLTGFFDADPGLIAHHARILGESLEHPLSGCPVPCIEVLGFGHRGDWHGLELRSPWLLERMHAFARESTARGLVAASVRVKTWHHLSLAYGFPPEQYDELGRLAGRIIDPDAPVDWQLRYYQRKPENVWICHRAWELPGS